MPALLLPNEILSMSAQAARRLTEAGDGDCALLYLALLASGGDTGRAGQSLRWPSERLSSTLSRLSSMGLAAEQGQDELPPPQKEPDRPPEYSRSDLADALEREPDFHGLYREVERLLDRLLTDNDLRCLYTLYDFLGLPSEVILLLTGYVLREYRREKDTPKASPRMPRVQKEGFRWKRMGIDTVERAEEYLRRQERVDAREWEILSAVGVTERRPAVEKEREFIAAWVEMDLSLDLIRLAYERTIYQKQTMNWPYMNKILLAWHGRGWTTPEQVLAEDRPPRRAQARKAPEQGREASFQPSPERIARNADWLDRFLEQQEDPQNKGG